MALATGLTLGPDHGHGTNRPHAAHLGSKDHIRRGVHVEVAIHTHCVRGVGGARERCTAGNQDLAVGARHALNALDALGTLGAGGADAPGGTLATGSTRATRGSRHTFQALGAGGAGQARGADEALGALNALETEGSLGAGGACGARRARGTHHTLDALLACGAHNVHARCRPHAGGLGSVQGAGRGVQVEVPVHTLHRWIQHPTQEGLGGDDRLPGHTRRTLRTRRSRSTRGPRRPHRSDESHGSHRTGATGQALRACRSRRSCGSRRAHWATGRSHQAHAREACPAAGAGLGSVEHIGDRIQVEVPHHTAGVRSDWGSGPVQHRPAIQARLPRGARGTRHTDGTLHALGAGAAGGTRRSIRTLGPRGAGRPQHRTWHELRAVVDQALPRRGPRGGEVHRHTLDLGHDGLRLRARHVPTEDAHQLPCGPCLEGRDQVHIRTHGCAADAHVQLQIRLGQHG